MLISPLTISVCSFSIAESKDALILSLATKLTSSVQLKDKVIGTISGASIELIVITASPLATPLTRPLLDIEIALGLLLIYLNCLAVVSSG